MPHIYLSNVPHTIAERLYIWIIHQNVSSVTTPKHYTHLSGFVCVCAVSWKLVKSGASDYLTICSGVFDVNYEEPQTHTTAHNWSRSD